MINLRKIVLISLLSLVGTAPQAAVVDLKSDPGALGTTPFMDYVGFISAYFISDNNFDSTLHTDINDIDNVNISTSSEHVSLINQGNGQSSHVYAFAMQPGELVIDIDGGWNGTIADNPTSTDSLLELYAGWDMFQYALLASNDNFNLADESYDAGSIAELDSFIQYDQSVGPGFSPNFEMPMYYLVVRDASSPFGFIPGGADYTLHISFAQPVPEPSVLALMLGGLGFVGFMANRQRKLNKAQLAA